MGFIHSACIHMLGICLCIWSGALLKQNAENLCWPQRPLAVLLQAEPFFRLAASFFNE